MAFSLMSAFGVASGLLDIFGGTRKKKDNSKIANAQEKLARQRYDYNIKESNDAYEENLRNTFAGYATQRMGVISTAKDEISKINAYGGTAQNVEMGESSIMLDALKEVNTNLDNNLKNSFISQDNALKGLVQENVALNYQLQNNLSDQIVNIKTKQAYADNQANQEIMNGMIGVGGSLLNMWNSNRGSAASLENIQNESFGNYLNSDFSSMLYPQYSSTGIDLGNPSLAYRPSPIVNNPFVSNPYYTGALAGRRDTSLWDNYFTGSQAWRGLGG